MAEKEQKSGNFPPKAGWLRGLRNITVNSALRYDPCKPTAPRINFTALRVFIAQENSRWFYTCAMLRCRSFRGPRKLSFHVIIVKYTQ